MRPLTLAITLGVVLLGPPSSQELRVLRTSPSTPADRTGPVVITFDRPVAGDLDRTVPAADWFRITPEVEGTARWRDPVSLVFQPTDALPPGTDFTVTVPAGLRAADGSELESPYRFEFSTALPMLIDGFPLGPYKHPQHLDPESPFLLAVDSPVDPAWLAARGRVAVGAPCEERTIALRAVGTRPVEEGDEQSMYRLDWWRDGAQEGPDHRRIVEVAPVEPLPGGCPAVLELPLEVRDEPSMTHWPMNVRGDLSVRTVACAGTFCPTGPVVVTFSNPVKGADVLRHVRFDPSVTFTVRDTARESASWPLQAELPPRQQWTVTVEPGLTDVFGQTLGEAHVDTVRTTGYEPLVSYEHGRQIVELIGARTLAVQHLNVDTLIVERIAVPDSLEARVLEERWSLGDIWRQMGADIDTTLVAVDRVEDRAQISGIAVPARSPGAAGGTLQMFQVSARGARTSTNWQAPIAVLQVTDLAVHSRVGVDQAAIWVTGVGDGAPRRGVDVTLFDPDGEVLAEGRTDEEGLLMLDGLDERCGDCSEGYLEAVQGGDRAVISLNDDDYDLSPWVFGAYRSWGTDREAVAAAVFTERGIYRPGEPVYTKAIVREGPLGALEAMDRDSLRWAFYDRDGGLVQDTVVDLSAFGTADRSFRLPADASLGTYRIEGQLFRDGSWTTYASAAYQVAEYRPPEFLVDAVVDGAPLFSGDSARAVISGRYLFGAPMTGMGVTWQARREPVSAWSLRIPGLEGWQVGPAYRWWEDGPEDAVEALAAASDTLDDEGRLALSVAATPPASGRPYRLSVYGTVTDLNRQSGSGTASVLVHPAAFYIGARQRSDGWFWNAGEPVVLEVITRTPEGGEKTDVEVRGTLIRREWHTVERTRNGVVQHIGSWVQDTVATCQVTTSTRPVPCEVTPPSGGSYTVAFEAMDDEGRPALTSFHRWAAGPGWVPWNDESEFKLDVIVDKEEYDVGDTATILIAAPFTNAEAWVTVERERLIESRRLLITEGATTLKLPIEERHAPNVFVSVLMVRGRIAAPGTVEDPGRPGMRVGYAEIKVKPDVKRLQVAVTTDRAEYRPRDTMQVEVAVTDAEGAGRRSEVTLWAVDEGVLALTGYETPDPVDLIYPPRGLGMYLASNLVSVAPQIPEGQKASVAPGGGGGGALAAILRSRFQSTAFFMGSVVTDEDGRGVARAALPDNLTTFRIMAVAVTDQDRYGSGQANVLVSLPLLARPALPRFVRPTDRFSAGVVVNSRLPDTVEVTVSLTARGLDVTDGEPKEATVAPLGGADVRFGFEATQGDSTSFTFSVEGGGEADVVRVGTPVRPMAYPLVTTSSGVLEDPVSTALIVDDDIDPSRSQVHVSFGSSPLAFIDGVGRSLRVYPYYCSEQVASSLIPMIAIYRAGQRTGRMEEGSAEEIQRAVDLLSTRQRPDGGIGYWPSSSWTSPVVTSYVGRALLEAQEAGFQVQDSVLLRMEEYLERSLSGEIDLTAVPVYQRWWSDARWADGERVRAVDFLSRRGRPNIPAENTLLENVANLTWDDRLVLAGALARRDALEPARAILNGALEGARVEGRHLILSEDVEPGERGYGYFSSRIGHVAHLVEAMLVLAPDHPLLGPAVERLVAGTRPGAQRWWWNTYDQGQAVLALVRFDERIAGTGPRTVSAMIGGSQVTLEANGVVSDTTLSLEALMGTRGQRVVPLYLQGPGDGVPLYYYVTLSGMPVAEHPEPVQQGLQVERWYEDPETGEPVTEAAEGDLVRVLMRVSTEVERGFVILDDPLPAGLEVVDLSLRTVNPGGGDSPLARLSEAEASARGYGGWEHGYWSPWDHREMRDERVVYSATILRPGTHVATYLARTTTAGSFLYPPAYAEEMYNPGVNGRSGGGRFSVTSPRP